VSNAQGFVARPSLLAARGNTRRRSSMNKCEAMSPDRESFVGAPWRSASAGGFAVTLWFAETFGNDRRGARARPRAFHGRARRPLSLAGRRCGRGFASDHLQSAGHLSSRPLPHAGAASCPSRFRRRNGTPLRASGSRPIRCA
jgi:hypothetical protein